MARYPGDPGYAFPVALPGETFYTHITKREFDTVGNRKKEMGERCSRMASNVMQT